MDVVLLYHLSLSSLNLSSVGTLVIFNTILYCVSKRSRFSIKGPELCAFFSVLLIITGVVVSDG